MFQSKKEASCVKRRHIYIYNLIQQPTSDAKPTLDTLRRSRVLFRPDDVCSWAKKIWGEIGEETLKKLVVVEVVVVVVVVNPGICTKCEIHSTICRHM